MWQVADSALDTIEQAVCEGDVQAALQFLKMPALNPTLERDLVSPNVEDQEQ